MTVRACGAIPAAGSQRFYRFEDDGRLHIVSSLDEVPSSLKAGAECVEAIPDAPAGAMNGASLHALAPWLEPWSFALGAGLVGAIWAGSALLRGRAGFALKLACALGVLALLFGLYFGALRRSAGTSDGSLLASPSAVINDAKHATDALQHRFDERDKMLREIERESSDK